MLGQLWGKNSLGGMVNSYIYIYIDSFKRKNGVIGLNLLV